MQIYLVGGAVRDELLGLAVTEKDWVVVGATIDEMIKLGFQPVGKEFPVFLHPTTKEEYALARTERKVAKGYQGFEFYTDPSVTLEQDLQRRDLTINAIAQTDSGELIDPFDGKKDLDNRLFRHVSDAFAEDPVRILRLARFSARFSDFTTHPDTTALMQQMVNQGEVDALVAERVWKECCGALTYADPSRFFHELHNVGALSRLFATEYDLASCQQRLKRACQQTENPVVRWAAWNMDLTPEAHMALARRFRLPKVYKELTAKVIAHAATYLAHQKNTDAESLLQLLLKIGGIKSESQLRAFQQVCQASQEKDMTAWNQAVVQLSKQINQISTLDLQGQDLSGPEFASKLYDKRLQVTQQWIDHVYKP